MCPPRLGWLTSSVIPCRGRAQQPVAPTAVARWVASAAMSLYLADRDVASSAVARSTGRKSSLAGHRGPIAVLQESLRSRAQYEPGCRHLAGPPSDRRAAPAAAEAATAGWRAGSPISRDAMFFTYLRRDLTP